MSLFVKKYQNNNKKNEKSYGLWYAKAVAVEEVGIEKLADEIEDNCTVKRSDILAVLSELGPAIRKEVQMSMKVRVPYLGCFRLGVSTKGAETAEDFTMQGNIKNVHVLFYPESKRSNGKLVKELARGVRVAEVPKNLQYITEDEDNTGGTGNSGNSGNSGDNTGDNSGGNSGGNQQNPIEDQP
jgi:predicted histone-like DNA-binding protein